MERWIRALLVAVAAVLLFILAVNAVGTASGWIAQASDISAKLEGFEAYNPAGTTNQFLVVLAALAIWGGDFLKNVGRSFVWLIDWIVSIVLGEERPKYRATDSPDTGRTPLRYLMVPFLMLGVSLVMARADELLSRSLNL